MILTRIFLFLSAVSLLSCSDNPVVVSADHSPPAQQLLDALLSEDRQFVATAPPQLPQDLTTHPLSRTESLQLQAIVSPVASPGQPLTHIKAAITARIDRMALTPEDNDLQAADSAWRYDDIMRLSVSSDARAVNTADILAGSREDQQFSQLQPLSATKARQSLQRVALGLAGVHPRELWVGKDHLMIAPSHGEEIDCRRVYQWQLDLSLYKHAELAVTFDECPDIRSFGAFNSWQQASATVRGTLTETADGRDTLSTALEGTAWLSHSWGNPPVPGGAVVIDSLQLRLDDLRWLVVSRSKRRSGRGPRIVSAAIHSDESAPQEIVVSWQDSTEQVVADSGTAYPASIELTSSDIDLTVSVTAMNRLTESSDFGEARLDTAVVLSGTHTGAGFLSFSALNQ
ncbi:MAG: hypothetical protein AB8B97_21520 [Granulosicoccus sp.]